MAIESRRVGDVSVLDFKNALTKGSGDLEMRECFHSLLDKGERRFLFDFRAVSYMDSAAIGETVACLKRAREMQGTVKILLVPDGRAHALFRLTALDRAFEIHADEQRALASFAG